MILPLALDYAVLMVCTEARMIEIILSAVPERRIDIDPSILRRIINLVPGVIAPLDAAVAQTCYKSDFYADSPAHGDIKT